MRAGFALAIAMMLGTLLPKSASAGELTYCVGGVTFYRTATISACRGYCHAHMQVTDGEKCYVCFDQCDNTCETAFLRSSPWASKFRAAQDNDCYRLGYAKGDVILTEVKDGQVIRDSASIQVAALAPAQLKTVIQSPMGTVAIGKPMMIRGWVEDTQGDRRQIESVSIRLSEPDGTTTEFIGTLESDNTFSVQFTPSQSGKIRVEVNPSGVTLKGNEGAPNSLKASADLQVDECRGQARILQPSSQALFLIGDSIQLRGRFEREGQPISTSTDGLEWVISQNGKTTTLPAVLDGADHSGTFLIPKGFPEGNAEIFLKAPQGSGLCGNKSHTITISKLGLALSATPVSTTCYIGTPCEVRATLIASNQAQAYLDSPELKVEGFQVGQAPGPLSKLSRTQWTFAFTPTRAARIPVTVRATMRGEVLKDVVHIETRWPIKMEKPEPVDFGLVEPGASWKDHCKKISLQNSEGLEDTDLQLTLTSEVQCEGKPLLQSDSIALPITKTAMVHRVSPSLEIPVCLAPPTCSSGVGEEVTVELKPTNPRFHTETKSVVLKWEIQGASTFECYREWFIFLIIGVVLAFLIAGFIVPKRFTGGIAIKVHRNEPSLRKAPPRTLRALPRGRGGWYRNAEIALGSDGTPLRKPRGALLVLGASAGGLVVQKGAERLQRWSKRQRKLEPASLVNGCLQPGAVYEIDGLWFTIV